LNSKLRPRRSSSSFSPARYEAQATADRPSDLPIILVEKWYMAMGHLTILDRPQQAGHLLSEHTLRSNV
jgi:hypothetical protein